MSSAERLKKLKALKARKVQHDSDEEEADYKIYDEVSNDEFRKVTRDRLMEDDFVIDDGVADGYQETGADDWEDGTHNYYSEDEQEDQPRKKRHKQKEPPKEKEKATRQDGNITKLFRSAPPKAKAKQQAPKEEKDEIIDDLISGLGNTPTQSSTPRDKKRKLAPRRRESSPIKREITPEPEQEPVKEPEPEPKEEPEPELKGEPEAEPEDVEMKEEEVDDDDDDGLTVKQLSGSVSTKQVNVSGVRQRQKEAKPEPPQEKPKPPQEEDTSSWLQVGQNLATADTEQKSANFEEVVDEKGDFQMFWTDYEEKSGYLFLYGKTKSKTEDKYSSCMVRLDNLFRTLYVLVGKDEEGEEQEDVEVYSELREIMRKYKVEKFFIKPEVKKYCFELPDVPRGEAKYMKLIIPFTAKIDWENLKADTFCRVFGSKKTAFEEFVVSKRIMGPCWLNLKNATEMPNASWCRITTKLSINMGFESTEDIEAVTDNEAPPAPPLTVMSLSIRTMNTNNSNNQEVFAISGRVYHNVAHDSTQPANEIKSVVFTEVRPLEQIFPNGFERLKSEHTGTHKTESSLLNKFVTMMQKYDPDVIVGHELLNVHLSVLCHRLKANRIKFWDKMGRRRQQSLPQGFGSSAYEYGHLREFTSGRLLCDLFNDLGRSMTTKCTSWTLTELCNLYLDEKRADMEINASKSTWNRDAEGLVRYLAHNEVDAYYVAALAFRIQMLALSKQLTNLAGNSWAKTLAGSRVDRNEFILLHEFTNQGYIVPDKGHSTNKEDGGSKDKFKGGMVLEPEKGLHKEIVLVMDFNSLYPSIIQEYNICFTTVERAECQSVNDPPPNPPTKEVPMGLFPQLVQNLVLRRREVKKLLKSPNATDTERAQWDIKQQALKLTANSMYGCLGYQGSRFYALPLAMLTTQKGREALQSTQELAEDNSLHVVYGDTDSVMLNTNVNNYKAALKVGEEFKKVVNQQYKHLEIDIDNVFQCILLQAKKKYAAMQMFERQNGEVDTRMEIKGLDLKRREFCQLSKEASNKILEQILTNEDFESAQEEIIDYTTKLAEDVRQHKIPEAKFIIRIRLGKDPSQYNNTDHMPAVRLAQRRKKNGEIIKPGDFMQFIICEGDGVLGDRAYTLAEFKRQQLTIDAGYYLAHQILPPLERLLTNIESAALPRLAQSMGLNVRKYNRPAQDGFTTQDRELQPLESTIPDKERFANAHRLELKCGGCSERFQYEGLTADSVTPRGIKCQACQTNISMTRVNAQLEVLIRKQIADYYAGWLVCDDPSCGVRTRQVNVYGKKCTEQDGDCRGVMHWEHNDKQLYNQLLYLDSLFDMDRAKDNAEGDDDAKMRVRALAEQNRHRFAVPRKVVGKYLANCGRRYVDMHNIFSFM